MTCSIHEAPSENHGEEVAKGITLLQHTRNEAPSSCGAVLERRRRCITVQTPHCDTEQGPYCEELLVGLTETGPKLEDDEEDVVHHKGPFPPVSIRRNAKNDGADRSKHEHKSDAPGNLRIGLVEVLGKIGDGQRDCKKVESVPRPCYETDLVVLLARPYQAIKKQDLPRRKAIAVR